MFLSRSVSICRSTLMAISKNNKFTLFLYKKERGCQNKKSAAENQGK